MSEFTVTILFVLLPGIFSAIVLEQLTANRSWSPFRFFLNAGALGVAAYLVLHLVLLHWGGIGFWNNLEHQKFDIRWDEVALATVVATVLAFILSFVANAGLVHRLGRTLKVTNRFSGDVWQQWLNMDELKEQGWIYVRDRQSALVYQGWVRLFSEANEPTRELFLVDVKVYQENGDLLYSVPAMYLSRKSEDIDIEIPKFGEKEVAVEVEG